MQFNEKEVDEALLGRLVIEFPSAEQQLTRMHLRRSQQKDLLKRLDVTSETQLREILLKRMLQVLFPKIPLEILLPPETQSVASNPPSPLPSPVAELATSSQEPPQPRGAFVGEMKDGLLPASSSANSEQELALDLCAAAEGGEEAGGPAAWVVGIQSERQAVDSTTGASQLAEFTGDHMLRHSTSVKESLTHRSLTQVVTLRGVLQRPLVAIEGPPPPLSILTTPLASSLKSEEGLEGAKPAGATEPPQEEEPQQQPAQPAKGKQTHRHKSSASQQKQSRSRAKAQAPQTQDQTQQNSHPKDKAQSADSTKQNEPPQQRQQAQTDPPPPETVSEAEKLDTQAKRLSPTPLWSPALGSKRTAWNSFCNAAAPLVVDFGTVYIHPAMPAEANESVIPTAEFEQRVSLRIQSKLQVHAWLLPEKVLNTDAVESNQRTCTTDGRSEEPPVSAPRYSTTALHILGEGTSVTEEGKSYEGGKPFESSQWFPQSLSEDHAVRQTSQGLHDDPPLHRDSSPHLEAALLKGARFST